VILCAPSLATPGPLAGLILGSPTISRTYSPLVYWTSVHYRPCQ